MPVALALKNNNNANSNESKPLNQLSCVRPGINSLFNVKLTSPVSSETTIVMASLTSLIPTAALWRVPNSFGIKLLSDSGKYALATAIFSFLIITAPSCSGVFGMKILISNSPVISASKSIPVSMYSSKPVLRSMVIKAPIFRFDMY